MQNTDSIWKRRMKLAAEEPDCSDSGYWLAPFRNFKADCPYIVGGYDRVGKVLASLISGGIEMFVLDISAYEEEFAHIRRAFENAKDRLGEPREAPARG